MNLFQRCCFLLPCLILPALPLPTQQPEPAAPAAAAPPASLALPRGLVLVDQPRNDSETRWVRGDDYKASFDAEAFTFVPFLGADAERNVPIRFALRSVQRGGVALDVRGKTVESKGNEIRVVRRDLTETYELTADNIKQSFVFDRLPGTGDLEIVVDVTTDMVISTHDGNLTFECSRGAVTYSDLIVVDARGTRLRLPIQQSNGAISLIIPGSYLAKATLPLVVDPVITNTTLATTTNTLSHPDLAWNETAQEFLVVYQVPFSVNDWDIVGIRTNLFMTPVGSPIPIDVTGFDWRNPRVANKVLEGMSLVVAEVEQNGSLPFIAGRRYEAIGNARTLHSQFEIERSTMTGGLSGFSLNPDVGGDPSLGTTPTYFTVVWVQSPLSGTSSDIYMRQIRANGSFSTLAAVPIDIGGNVFRQSVAISKSASTTGVHGMTWSQHGPWGLDRHIVATQRLSDGGLHVVPFYVDSSPNNDLRPRISTMAQPASGTQRFLITWERHGLLSSPTLPQLYCAAMTTSPWQPLLATWNLSSVLGIPSGTAATAPVVDSDGVRFVVAHLEQLPSATRTDLRVSTLALSGTSLLVHEGRVELATSGPSITSTSIASTYGGGAASSRSYGLAAGSSTPSVMGWLYNGHAPGSWFTVRGGGCGGLNLSANGYPIFGHSVDLALDGSDPFKAILFGFPMPLTPISVCTNCMLGVTGGGTVPSPYNWLVPYVPTFVGLTLTAQGYSIGSSGSCLGVVRISDAVDFRLR